MADETRCWRVHGRVQGVFFRASTQRQARPLGLAGYALNLPDGTVEVAARGPAQALDDLEQWLKKGPPAARVDRLENLDGSNARPIPEAEFRTG